MSVSQGYSVKYMYVISGVGGQWICFSAVTLTDQHYTLLH